MCLEIRVRDTPENRIVMLILAPTQAKIVEHDEEIRATNKSWLWKDMTAAKMGHSIKVLNSYV